MCRAIRSAVAGVLLLISALVTAGPTSIKLPGAGLYPESLSSSSDGTLYVGSLGKGGVLRIEPNGAPKQWIKPGAFGSASTLGVLVDEASSTLWLCSNDLSGVGVKVRGAMSGSALLGFDLKTGRGKLKATLPGSSDFCNDIAIGPDGSAYVTNSGPPQILKLAAGIQVLEVWFSDSSLQPAPNGTGLDGIAFGRDGNLYFNLFDAAELYRIDIKDGKPGRLTKLKPSRKLVLTDGMRARPDGSFLLIEGEGRLDSLVVKNDEAIVTTLKDGYVTPTGVTSVGEIGWVAEGQLDYLFDPAKKGQKPRLPFKIYPVPVNR